MDQFHYFAVLGVCLAATLPLEFIYGFKVWRNPRRLAKALTPGFIIFAGWDAAAIAGGHWTFSDRYTTGWDLFGGFFPVEELLFFIVVPAAAISGFEAVRCSLRRNND